MFWVASADEGYDTVSTGGTTLMQSNASLAGTTITRVRGLLSVGLQVYSADLPVIGAMGMAVVSDEAVAAGAASIPGPWTNSDWGGWFVWMPWIFNFEFTTDIDRLLGSVEWELDSKAQRKVKNNETVVVMAESQAGAVIVGTPFRMLVKLS